MAASAAEALEEPDGDHIAAPSIITERTRECVLSLSYGKDSLACLGAIEELGWPLDRIIHAEVWATDTIPADLPPMVEFKAKADAIIKERWGMEVEHVRSKLTYEARFYQVRSKKARSNPGVMYGFAMRRGPWCNSDLKVGPLEKEKRNCISYLGIAADEPNRFSVLSDTKKSPLLEAGWTEAMCWEWCENNGLLSPIYTAVTRGGCWFCHNQSVRQLRLLRQQYPEYWALLLKWDGDSPSTFHSDGHTVHDFDRRFQLEDQGLISADDKIFRWSMLEEPLNFRLF